MKLSAQLLTFMTLLIVLAFGYQNCSPSNSQVAFTSDSIKTNNEGDSGTPYEGKIYAVLGSLCGDGSEVHSRILMTSSTKALLNRQNCQDIKPVELAPTDYQVSSDSQTLVYKNQDYKFMGFGPLGISNFSISNDVNNFYYSYTYQGQPSWLQVYLDTDNNPATGYYHDGIGADFLIENDYLWQYSPPPGSPQSTWAWTSLVSANKNNVAPNISWSFARNAIGSPSIMKVMAHTSLGSQTAIITQTPQ